MSRTIKKFTNNPGGYITIDRYVIRCDAFKLLSSSSIKLLVLMCHDYNGKNNGDISVPFSKYKGSFRSSQTLFNARDELERLGFIAVNAYGGMSYGGTKLPTLYALTWLPVDDFVDLDKNLFRKTHLPIGVKLKYFLKGENPKYKKPKGKKKQYIKDLKNPNINHNSD